MAPASEPEEVSSDERPSAYMRSDAIASRQRIIAAAATLAGDRRASMAEIAAAAGVGRSTLYRHFPTREALSRALREAEQSGAGASAAESTASPSPYGRVSPIAFQRPGQLGAESLALEVTRILDEVPPHLVPDQLVAEARRAAGVPVALYVVDIDGSHLLRLAGTPEFPELIDNPPALGPEIVPEGLPGLYEQLARRLPGCVAEPLWLRGRVIGLLLCIGTPAGSVADIARQGAAALELANDYTDLIESARRRKPTTPAAEIQQNLFPPRIARIAGAQLAGVLLPTYEVGGDWFDFVENRDGTWLAIADAAGKGPTAAGLGAAALGALRAARRSSAELEDALALMDETVRMLDNETFFVTAWVGRWHAATAELKWINCGHGHGFLCDADGELNELQSPDYAPLGTGSDAPKFRSSSRQLRSRERLILVTDGVIGRRVEGGGTFGTDGLARAVRDAEDPTAASTAISIQRAVTSCWQEPLDDDATVVVMAVD
jgi:serine phosphatase RsbU (regulator of sigma subunit)/DNA-binding phage protein